MRAVRPLATALLALLAASVVGLSAAAPAGAAQLAGTKGTAGWAVLEEAAKPKGKRSALKPKRATASAKAQRTAAKRPAKPRRRRERPVQASVPRPVTASPLVPNDPLWKDSWSLAKVNALAAWNVTAGAPETIVAVLDTGVDLAHPDLQGALVQGYDTVNEDANPSDDHGHGTMVAGVIAARANNGIGAAGACWRCSVMPVKVIGADGLGSVSDIAEGIYWATAHGARVINMSFTLTAPDGAIGAAIEHARAQGVVLVAAAGNSGTTAATYPGAYPGVVSVAGTDAADARYGWSSYGSWVRLAAPGCSQTTAPAGGYGDFCGTSSAAAFVSGLAGLARSFAAQLPADAIAEALSSNAVPVGDFVSTGRVDAAAILGALRSQTP